MKRASPSLLRKTGGVILGSHGDRRWRTERRSTGICRRIAVCPGAEKTPTLFTTVGETRRMSTWTSAPPSLSRSMPSPASGTPAGTTLTPPSSPRSSNAFAPSRVSSTGCAPGLANVTTVGEIGSPLGLAWIKDDELYQLYVASEARGTGVAAALISTRNPDSATRASKWPGSPAPSATSALPGSTRNRAGTVHET